MSSVLCNVNDKLFITRLSVMSGTDDVNFTRVESNRTGRTVRRGNDDNDVTFHISSAESLRSPQWRIVNGCDQLQRIRTNKQTIFERRASAGTQGNKNIGHCAG
jgi:hypothetical protein